MTVELLPGQSTYQLGDLVLNARDDDGVEWIVETDDDWWAGPPRRVTHLERPFADGAGRSRSFAAVRKLTFEGCVIAPSRALLDERLGELAALCGDGALQTLIGPAPDDNYRIGVELSEAPDIDRRTNTYARWQFTLYAPDPVKYSNTQHEAQAALPLTTGGLEFPVTFPITFPATTVTGSAQLTNSGTATVGIQIRIDGPANNPFVTLARGADFQTLNINLSIASGQWLEIDTAARTVLLNGTANRRGSVSGIFPTLARGTSFLTWNADSHTTALLTARWRSGRY